MKQIVVLVQLLVFGLVAQGQSFEGTLTYEQKMGANSSEVLLQLQPNRVHIKRNEAKVLHYVYQADGQLTAWAKGGTKPTFTEVAALSVPKITLTGQKQLMAGMEAFEFRFNLKDGAVFTGWYTPALKVNHNTLLTPIQGELWGYLPTEGVLMQWQVKSPKQNIVIEGKLTDFKAESLPSNAFTFE